MSSPARVVELAAADGFAGGKARGLARLIAAGLPVPDGFALTIGAFADVIDAAASGDEHGGDEHGGGAHGGGAIALDDIGARIAAWAAAVETAVIPPALDVEVAARARRLGGPLIVRSSMAIEDGAGGAAPGLAQSIGDVAPDDVWTAIRAVWVSSLTPLVATYARRAAAGTSATRDDAAWPGVIVQRQVSGARWTVLTRPPGKPDGDEVWLASGGATERVPRSDARAAVRLALAAERAIADGADASADGADASADGADASADGADASADGAGADREGADVELIEGADGTWSIVQARPIVHPAPRPPRHPPPPMLLASLDPARGWRRDVTHNPDPLSVAQTGLCERVERAAIAPFHLAVIAGHLYVAPRAGADPTAVANPTTVADADELEARFAAHTAALDRILSRVDRTERADANLAAAIDAYLDAYRILAAEVAPLVAAGRAVLVDSLRRHGLGERDAIARAAALAPRRPSSLAAAIADAASGRIDRATLLARIGDFAIAWDVAAPTFAEAPARIDDAIARARARPPAAAEPDAPPGLEREVALARAAADAAERDDLWWARAQAMVRRALLAVADGAGLARDDVFWLPLDDLVAAGVAIEPIDRIDPLDRDRAAGRATAARSAARRAAAWDMPVVPGAEPPASTDRWQGEGFGERVAGPAAVIASLTEVARVPPHAVVVAAAITPALALIVEGAAALVCEHGSLLDHGAAMARELGIPCVVGCRGIAGAIADGEWLEVDGDRGTIDRIGARIGR